jgi:hypothetical protein
MALALPFEAVRSRGKISLTREQEKNAVRETKRLVDVANLPPDVEIAPEWGAFLASVKRPLRKESVN